MFVTNPTMLSNVLQTKNKIVAKYLQGNSIPLLSMEDGIFYFSQTKQLEQCLKNAPFWIRWLL